MKRSLRRPLAVLLLVVLCAGATFPAALRRAATSGGRPRLPAAGEGAGDRARLNETLLRLAAADPSEGAMQRDVDDLLEGRLPAASARSRGGRRNSLHLRHHLLHRRRHDAGDRLDPLLHPIQPQDFLVDPSLRRAVRGWHRRRRFDPSVLRELPALLTGGRRLPSCAVVGNSGILLRSRHGPLIDSHAAVLRLNNARIAGFSPHVGSKTNLSFINSNILHLCARRRGCFCHPYGDGVPILMYVCQAAHFLDVAACNTTSTARHNSPISITDARLDVLCARIVKYYSLRRFVADTGRPVAEWDRAHDALMFHYSSGMQAIMVAVGVCDSVSVFGFGKAADAKHHYHTNQKAELDLHDYEAEYDFYRDLAERHQVIPFLKEAGIAVPPVVFYH